MGDVWNERRAGAAPGSFALRGPIASSTQGVMVTLFIEVIPTGSERDTVGHSCTHGEPDFGLRPDRTATSGSPDQPPWPLPSAGAISHRSLRLTGEEAAPVIHAPDQVEARDECCGWRGMDAPDHPPAPSSVIPTSVPAATGSDGSVRLSSPCCAC